MTSPDGESGVPDGGSGLPTEGPGSPAVRGARPSTVRRAVETRDPFPGTRGFAGALDRGVVRDVLGRQPVYTEGDDPTAWAFDPGDLTEPDVVPAGHLRTEDGDERLWTLPDPEPERDERTAVERVRTAVRESLDAVETDGLAVGFSGGVDSVAVASGVGRSTRGESDGETDSETGGEAGGEAGTEATDRVPLYVVGFEGSHDVAAARSAAAALDRDVSVVDVSHDDVERGVRAVVDATGRTNAMDVQIAVPLYLLAERVAADGHRRLALGQGADELFGGYAKVAGAPEDSRVAADTVRGARREVVRTLPRQLERDVLTIRHAGVQPVVPLLDDRVVDAALALPGSLLVSHRGDRNDLGGDADGGDGAGRSENTAGRSESPAGTRRKVAFRRAVGAWVPDDLVDREKKALQYGSDVSRELDRLARQAGFKRRLNDHVTKYVESLVDSCGRERRPSGSRP